MGWFWGADDGDKPSSSSQDPLRDLDPELRKFLQKESPVKYTPQPPPPPQASAPAQEPSSSEPRPSYTSFFRSESSNAPPPSSSQQHSQSQSQDSATSTSTADSPEVPPQSLFPDGRYAHLWKTYVPLADIEAANKTDNEKVLDILDGYKYRKAEIGRAALENCADEQWIVNACFGSGSVSALTSMCRKENQALSRCYVTQAKFLKALGYLSTFDRDPEINERIQMHADKLYHTMLEQEEAIELAKKEGRPAPAFPPLLQVPSSSSTSTSTSPSNSSPSPKPTQSQPQPKAKAKPQSEPEPLPPKFSDLPASTRSKISKRLEGLSGRERDLEEQSILAELQAGENVLSKLDKVFTEQEKERKERKEAGNTTLQDWVWGTFSPRRGGKGGKVGKEEDGGVQQGEGKGREG